MTAPPSSTHQASSLMAAPIDRWRQSADTAMIGRITNATYLISTATIISGTIASSRLADHAQQAASTKKIITRSLWALPIPSQSTSGFQRKTAAAAIPAPGRRRSAVRQINAPQPRNAAPDMILNPIKAFVMLAPPKIVTGAAMRFQSGPYGDPTDPH